MKSKPLLFQIPFSLIAIVIFANFAGFVSSTAFQSLYVVFFNHLGEETLSTKIMYCMGAGQFIAFLATPFSIIIVAIISSFSTEFGKWHLITACIVGILFGFSMWGSIYWGVPMLAYCFTTAMTVVLLVFWRQKHLTKN